MGRAGVLIWLVLLMLQEHALAQDLRARDLQWASIFGTVPVDTDTSYGSGRQASFGAIPSGQDTIYTLLGRGYFLADRSEEVQGMIAKWVIDHPDARVIPVTSSGPVMVYRPNSRNIYCWLVDGEENLNELIIRWGGYPGGTMRRPETWDELPEWEKELYPEEEKGNGATVLIDEASYLSFVQRINEAEQEARAAGPGIWGDQRIRPTVLQRRTIWPLFTSIPHRRLVS